MSELLCDNLEAEPAVAVLVCVHCGADPEQFVEAMMSLRAQTHKSLRILLYCDGPLLSAHEAAIARFLRVSPGPDRIVRGETAQGLPTGLNRLIELALEDPAVAFMARMDADDIAVPERIERQVAFLRCHPNVAVAGSWCVEFSKQNVPRFHKRMPETQEDVRRAMLFRNALAHPTVIFRRHVLERGYRYDPKYVFMQDYELWTRMIAAGEVISNVPEYLLWFRVNDGFFSRRRGIRRAWREVMLRLNYARQTRLISTRVLVGLAALFLVRAAPSAVGSMAYKMRR